MSVVESTHEQSLITEAGVVFFPMDMLKSVLYSWLSFVMGKWICPLIAMQTHNPSKPFDPRQMLTCIVRPCY